MYKVKCQVCDKCDIGQTGGKFAALMHEHQLATKRYDLLSIISVHEDQKGHTFNVDAVYVVDQATIRYSRNSGSLEIVEKFH